MVTLQRGGGGGREAGGGREREGERERRKEENGQKWLQHKAQPIDRGEASPKFKVVGNPPP